MNLESWRALDPLLVWGLFSRGLGVVYLISFLSLSGQVLAHAGQGGVMPVERVLARMRRDFVGWRRWLHFPTLLWFSASDAALRGLTFIGMAAAVLVICGGPASSAALLICYACYLSLDLAMALIFPWDCLLFEATLLGLFLPATAALPDLQALATPAPAVAWAYRLLVFRLMFGFGKQKFLGSRRQDLAYLKGFLVNQPLPSKVAWYAQKLPLCMLQAGVVFMAVVELPVAFLALVPGPASLVCAGATLVLMLGIQLMGTFGYFSLVTSVLCLTLLDQSTPRALDLTSADTLAAASLYVLAHTLCGGFALLFNSWLGQSWHNWAYWYQLPRWVQPFFGFLRLLHPFRWLHPYGVFPPNSTPPVRLTLAFEACWGGAQWHPLEFPYSPVHRKSAPRFIAPHHPRGDQALIYDTFGLNATSLMNGVIGVHSPYPFASRMPLHFFCQAILRGQSHDFVRGRALAEHPDPPGQVRVTTHLLEPVTLAEHRESGAWWRRRYVGPHVPPMQRDAEFWSDALGEPELWHVEAITWRRRSRLNLLMKAALEQGADPLVVALVEGSGLGAADIERFWESFAPLSGAPASRSFDNLPGAVAELHQRFARPARRTQYRLLARFALCLVARLEPLYLHRGARPLIPVPTYFHLWMLAYHIIGLGQDAYLRAFAEPLSACQYVPQLTPATGLFGLALFRFDEFTFEAQKLRLIEAFTYPHHAASKRRNADCLRSLDLGVLLPVEQRLLRIALSVSGFFHVLVALRDAFRGPAFERGQPERYPRFRELDSGEIRLEPPE